MAAITLQSVVKEFADGFKAVRDVSFTIADGELLILVGPSGCGKSTLLRLLAGLESVTSGTIALDDVEITHTQPQKRDLAMVFQSYALYPHKTVEENIAFPLRMKGLTKAEILPRVRSVAAMLEISSHLSKKPSQLSGGERQRVALARALIREPKAFLLDEPLSNLDAKLREHTRSEISRIHKRTQTTMVYVTHDQHEAMTLGDRLVVMQAGTVQQIGMPMDVYRRPANTFVAGFIGAPAMNIEHATIRQQGSTTTVISPSLTVRLKQHLAQPDGAPILLGIRPSDCRIVTEEHLPLQRIERIELLGATQLIYLESGLRIEAPISLDLTTSTDVQVSAPADRIHLFNPTTGERLEM